MAQYDRVVAAMMESTAFTAANTGVIELQVGASVMAEIIRIEIGAAEGTDPVAETQELAFYVNDAAGTGTAVTEAALNGSGTIQGVAISNVTVGATPTEIWFTGFHWSTGYLYLPVPEERIQIKGGSTTDNFGFYFPTAPDASTTFSATLVWGEIG